MFREIILPIFRSTRLCVTAYGVMHPPRCCRPSAGNHTVPVRERGRIRVNLWKPVSTFLLFSELCNILWESIDNVHFITDSYNTHSSHDLTCIFLYVSRCYWPSWNTCMYNIIWDLTKSRLISVTFENTITNYRVTIVVILQIIWSFIWNW